MYPYLEGFEGYCGDHGDKVEGFEGYCGSHGDKETFVSGPALGIRVDPQARKALGPQFNQMADRVFGLAQWFGCMYVGSLIKSLDTLPANTTCAAFQAHVTKLMTAVTAEINASGGAMKASLLKLRSKAFDVLRDSVPGCAAGGVMDVAAVRQRMKALQASLCTAIAEPKLHAVPKNFGKGTAKPGKGTAQPKPKGTAKPQPLVAGQRATTGQAAGGAARAQGGAAAQAKAQAAKAANQVAAAQKKLGANESQQLGTARRLAVEAQQDARAAASARNAGEAKQAAAKAAAKSTQAVKLAQAAKAKAK